MERVFKKDDIIQHFKRETLSKEELEKEPKQYLYEVIGVAMHTETGKELMIYRALYGENRIFARPLDMFMEKVDKEKYPEIKQVYRLEKYATFALFEDILKTKDVWIAFKNLDNVKYGKVVNGNGRYLDVVCDTISYEVSYETFIGICQKPTKENSIPIIID